MAERKNVVSPRVTLVIFPDVATKIPFVECPAFNICLLTKLACAFAERRNIYITQVDIAAARSAAAFEVLGEQTRLSAAAVKTVSTQAITSPASVCKGRQIAAAIATRLASDHIRPPDVRTSAGDPFRTAAILSPSLLLSSIALLNLLPIKARLFLALRTSIHLRHLLPLHLRPFEFRPFLTLRTSIHLRHLLPLHLRHRLALHLRHLLTLRTSIHLRHLLALHLRTLHLRHLLALCPSIHLRHLLALHLRTLRLRHLRTLRRLRSHDRGLSASAFITAATAFSLALCGNIADRANG
jgi:hypothetical protein